MLGTSLSLVWLSDFILIQGITVAKGNLKFITFIWYILRFGLWLKPLYMRCIWISSFHNIHSFPLPWILWFEPSPIDNIQLFSFRMNELMLWSSELFGSIYQSWPNIRLPQDPEIPLLSISTREINICTPKGKCITEASFIMTLSWKQWKSPQTIIWINCDIIIWWNSTQNENKWTSATCTNYDF